MGEIFTYAGPQRTSRQQARENSLHIIKYMGSKRELLPAVREAVGRITPDGGTVLDLFAGAHSVGWALRDHYRIIGADIQAYSRPIGETLLGTWGLPSADSVWEQLKPHYEHNQRELEDLFADVLAEEREIVQAGPVSTAAEVRRFADFQRTALPDPRSWSAGEAGGDRAARTVGQLVADRRRAPTLFPYLQTVAYFGNTYLSVRHAAQTDSLRYAIDQAFPSGHRFRAAALSALMFAVSYTNSTPGHFAMWRDAANIRNTNDLLLYRRRDLLAYFTTKLAEMSERLIEPHSTSNQVLTGDYRDVLAAVDDVHSVYADPPYSFVHYSRFYHLLETLVRYDYPTVAHRGRFRDDRHQSPFCIRSRVRQAFYDLAVPLARRRVPLLVSYSDTGMISLTELLGLLSDVFPEPFSVWAEQLDHEHSTMGRRGDKTREVTEALIFCAERGR